MKEFDTIEFDAAACRDELVEFKALLDANTSLKERESILPFFRKHPQIVAFIGSANPSLGIADLIAYEYQLYGDFACDLVVGNWKKNAYCFVELEDASPNSVFIKRPKKAIPEWAPRFDHGFSQLIDWFHKLDDMRSTVDFQNRFGGSRIDSIGLLIVGRGTSFDPREADRLAWRQRHVLVNSNRIICLTYDQLYEDLVFRLNTYPKFARKSRRKKATSP